MNPSATARKGLQEVSVTAFGISLVLLALLGTPGACGQPKHFGVKAGATASSLQLEYSPSSGITSGATRTHWGLDAGIFAEWLDGPLVTLMTEVHFVEQRLPVGLEARYDGTIGSEYSNDVVDIHGAWALSILLTVGL